MSLEDLKEKLSKVVEPGDMVPRDYEKDGCLLEIKARAEQVEAVAKAALEADCFLESIAAVDFTNGPQIIYQFNSCTIVSRVLVRVQLSRGESVVSIGSIYDAALWY